jgi:hypothetical protein
MFLMSKRFKEIINHLELSYRLIKLNNFSIPEDKSGEAQNLDEPQKEVLDDDLRLLFSISS